MDAIFDVNVDCDEPANAESSIYEIQTPRICAVCGLEGVLLLPPADGLELLPCEDPFELPCDDDPFELLCDDDPPDDSFEESDEEAVSDALSDVLLKDSDAASFADSIWFIKSPITDSGSSLWSAMESTISPDSISHESSSGTYGLHAPNSTVTASTAAKSTRFFIRYSLSNTPFLFHIKII